MPKTKTKKNGAGYKKRGKGREAEARDVVNRPPAPTNGNGAWKKSQQARPPLGVVSSTGSYFGSYVLGGRAFVPTPYNPDDLARRKGIKIYRQMMQDEQVKAALSAKKLAVVSTGWAGDLPDTAAE